MSRAAIEELLRAGWSDRAIGRHVHAHVTRIKHIREQLGLPPHQPGPSPAASLPDAFWRRAEPATGGHLLWPGTRRVAAGDQRDSPARVAFRIGNAREPVGKVTAGCGRPGCVHPRHVEDEQMRTQYAAIFGAAS